MKKNNRRDKVIFFNQMLLWVYAKERGEELEMPAELAKYRKFREQWQSMNEFFERKYKAEGMAYMKQVLAEAREKGWVLDPDEFIKEFGGSGC